MQIRPATEADIHSVLTLYAQLEPDRRINVPMSRAVELFRKIESYPNYHLYVAERDGAVVGTFSLAILDNLAHFAANTGLIEDVVVDEALRRTGIGREMMRYAMELCRQNACYKVNLSSNLNREDAHRFYESLGFQKHGYSFRLHMDLPSPG